MALAGLSTLGITFGYGVETTAGTKPSTFSQLTRINSIGGISITPETIDASALEDAVEKSVAGRASTGATWEVVINYTPDTATEWANVISAYNTGKASGYQTWFEVIVPSMSYKPLTGLFSSHISCREELLFPLRDCPLQGTQTCLSGALFPAVCRVGQCL